MKKKEIGEETELREGERSEERNEIERDNGR